MSAAIAYACANGIIHISDKSCIVSPCLRVVVAGVGNEGRQILSDHSMEPFFIGPDGTRITLTALPPRDLLNLTVSQKAMVVTAVRYGLLTISEACQRYHLSLDEYLHWHGSFAGEAGGERP